MTYGAYVMDRRNTRNARIACWRSRHTVGAAECVRRSRAPHPPPEGGQSGWSALMQSAYNGHTEAVKALIEAGAKKDLQDTVSLLLPPSLPPSLYEL